MKKFLPLILIIIGLIALFVYLNTKLPPDVESKGDPIEFYVQLISLITAILSFASAIVTFFITVRQRKDVDAPPQA